MPQSGSRKQSNWPVAITDAEKSVVMSWHASSAPLLRARWQMHTGGRCTWPSAIRADTLIFHCSLESLFLLSLNSSASAHIKTRNKWFKTRESPFFPFATFIVSTKSFYLYFKEALFISLHTGRPLFALFRGDWVMMQQGYSSWTSWGVCVMEIWMCVCVCVCCIQDKTTQKSLQRFKFTDHPLLHTDPS